MILTEIRNLVSLENQLSSTFSSIFWIFISIELLLVGWWKAECVQLIQCCGLYTNIQIWLIIYTIRPLAFNLDFQLSTKRCNPTSSDNLVIGNYLMCTFWAHLMHIHYMAKLLWKATFFCMLYDFLITSISITVDPRCW